MGAGHLGTLYSRRCGHLNVETAHFRYMEGEDFEGLFCSILL
jgi:hypothetical protein